MLYTYQLIRGNKAESYKEFTQRIFDITSPLVSRQDIDELKVTLTNEAPPPVSVIPFGKSKIAAIRIGWHDETDDNPFEGLDGRSGSFVVEEALPVAYDKTWPDGQRTPGVCLLTLFRQRKDIDYETFINRWHNGHTPLSLDIHPLWHYSRNVVTRRWQDDEPWYDGIVEEHCLKRSDLMNPLKFFGNAFTMIPNMIRVYFDVRSFLDYPAVEPYLTSEFILKSQRGSHN